MTRQLQRRPLWAALASLGWPLMIGLALATLFFVGLVRGPLETPMLDRYFLRHPVSILATCMFFVGLTSLGMKLAHLVAQQAAVRRLRLAPSEDGTQSPEEAGGLLEELQSLPATIRDSYLGSRLQGGLEHIERTRSAESLEEELRFLSDADAARQHESYSLVRIIIWATPMLGFLGTVIGLTQALGNLDPQEMATAIESAMQKLTSGLYVAFDTTALALSLSILLMFLQFLVERLETQLLELVDGRASEELLGRFDVGPANADPHVASVRRMGEAVMQSSSQLVERQAALWQQSLDSAHERWSRLSEDSRDQIRSALETALDESLARFSERVAAVEEESADRLARRWEQWQTALSHNARLLHDQQKEMSRQTELIGRILEATGDIQSLEQQLNENLRALAGARHFEETVMSLSAAIHLLNANLGRLPGLPGSSVDLSKDQQAA